MVLIAPLLAAAMPAMIQVGGSLLSGLLNKPSAAERALQGATVKSVKLGNEILGMRKEFLSTLQGERENFRKAILNKKGQPLVMRLQGVGGISDEQWAKQLNEAMGAIDFGGKRAWDAGMQLLPQMSAGVNSIGAGAGLASQMSGQRQQAIGGTAGFLSDLGTSVYDKFQNRPAPVQVPSQSAGIAPIQAPSLTDGLTPEILAAAMQSSAPMPVPEGQIPNFSLIQGTPEFAALQEGGF